MSHETVVRNHNVNRRSHSEAKDLGMAVLAAWGLLWGIAEVGNKVLPAPTEHPIETHYKAPTLEGSYRKVVIGDQYKSIKDVAKDVVKHNPNADKIGVQ